MARWSRDAVGRMPLAGTGLGLAWAGAVLAVLVPLRTDTSRATPALALVVGVVAAGVVGGVVAAAFVAFVSAAVLKRRLHPSVRHAQGRRGRGLGRPGRVPGRRRRHRRPGGP